MKKVEIPNIDINALIVNGVGKRKARNELIAAFEEIGFAVLVGHGIEKKRLSEMRELLIRVLVSQILLKKGYQFRKAIIGVIYHLDFSHLMKKKFLKKQKMIFTRVSNCIGNAPRNIL